MKLKNKPKIVTIVFFWLIILFAVTNPLLSGINVYYTSSNLSAVQPSQPDGLSVQGSLFVNQVTKTVSATNSTGQQVQAYETTIAVFNVGALMILLSPLVLIIYMSTVKPPKESKRVKKTEPETKDETEE